MGKETAIRLWPAYALCLAVAALAAAAPTTAKPKDARHRTFAVTEGPEKSRDVSPPLYPYSHIILTGKLFVGKKKVGRLREDQVLPNPSSSSSTFQYFYKFVFKVGKIRAYGGEGIFDPKDAKAAGVLVVDGAKSTGVYKGAKGIIRRMNGPSPSRPTRWIFRLGKGIKCPPKKMGYCKLP